MHPKALKTLLSCAALAALSACGGGGDTTAPSAEGFWGGTSASGTATALIVLSDGETWGAYGNDSTDSAGIFHGNLGTTGSAVTGSLYNLNLTGAGSATLAVTGSVSTRNALNLGIGSSGTVGLSYDSSYDRATSLSALAGTYNGQAVSGSGADSAAVLQVSSAGVVTTSGSVSGCSGAGTVSLRDSRKSILNFAITFSGTGCLLPTGTQVTGVVHYDSNTGDLEAVGLNSAKTLGLLLTASKVTSG